MENIESTADISREWMSWQKILHLFRVLFSKQATEVLWAYKKFTDIWFETLWSSWKRGIVLDVDECIAPHHWMVFDENIQKIEELKKDGWEIVIFSNMKKTNRYQELENLWIPVCTSVYSKPDPRWFIDALDLMKLNLDMKQVVMIGDNYLTDGWSMQAGIDFIKIQPIDTWEKKQSISRRVQKIMRSTVDIIATARWNLNYQ
jgi:HAD superfamily phosphatase (TIGR01668 family)